MKWLLGRGTAEHVYKSDIQVIQSPPSALSPLTQEILEIPFQECKWH